MYCNNYSGKRMSEDLNKLKNELKELKEENNKLKNKVKDLNWELKRLIEINAKYRSKEQVWFTADSNSIGERVIGCETDCGGDCSICPLSKKCVD
jgi:uncharacterized coiled-coil DUF342 family protein